MKVHLKQNTLYRLCGATFLTLLLCACTGNDAENTAQNPEVSGARSAVVLGDIFSPRRIMRRPSAPLGLFVTQFLSSGEFLPVQGAHDAAIAHARLHAKPSEEEQETVFTLLEEFGTVLQVDVPDLLNRSDNRGDTLDAYLDGLKNITGRSRLRTREIVRYIDELKLTERTERQAASQIERTIRDATREQDYATAAENQQELVKAETALRTTQLELDQQESLQEAFGDLLDIADERVTAIETNREVLIAGLKVIEVPGIENLGIFEDVRRR